MIILHIEDDQLLARSVARALRRAGFEVTSARTAAEAVTVLQYRTFDAVLSDYNLEGGTAAEVVDWVRVHRAELLGRWVWLTSDDAALQCHAAPLLDKPSATVDVVAALRSVVP